MPPSIPRTTEQEARGKAVYERRCVGCHGPNGDGNGPMATFLDPRPRDFRLGAFKFRTTPSGSLPTDGDLYRTLTRGLRFKAVIERLSQRFTMFREDGVPVRATLNVTFKEYKTIDEQLNPRPNQSSDWTKRRIIVEFDRLCLIAAAEYEDPAVWRVIADANEIENPRLLQPGVEIQLPPLR